MKKLFIISYLVLFSSKLFCQHLVDGVSGYVGLSSALYYFEYFDSNIKIDYKNKKSFVSQIEFYSTLNKKIKLNYGILYYQRKYNMFRNDSYYVGVYEKHNNHYINVKAALSYNFVRKDKVSFNGFAGVFIGTRVSNNDLFYDYQSETWLINLDTKGRKPLPQNTMLYAILGFDYTFKLSDSYAIVLRQESFIPVKGDYRNDRGASYQTYYNYYGDVLIYTFQVGLMFKF